MTFAVFGYGSLVNTLTLPDHRAVWAATVTGWRRAWCASGGGSCALSIVEAENQAIDGLVVVFDDAMWPEVRAREKRYRWFVLPDFPETVITFRAGTEADRWADEINPVHLSYVDTVLQGYLRKFGSDGGRRFVETTAGWDVPFVDDREAPRYPRATPLDKTDRAQIDDLLRSAGVSWSGHRSAAPSAS